MYDVEIGEVFILFSKIKVDLRWWGGESVI